MKNNVRGGYANTTLRSHARHTCLCLPRVEEMSGIGRGLSLAQRLLLDTFSLWLCSDSAL